MISANYHDITQLLLLMIIGSSKNYTISIIGKENITVNRQNRLIAHPYYKPHSNTLQEITEINLEIRNHTLEIRNQVK